MAQHSLLPPNATALERVVDQLFGARLANIDSAYRAWWSADGCPAADLPWLAWALSVDEWDPSWPEPVRRAQVGRAIAVAKRKGTVGGVTEVIASFGGAVVLREWWQTSPPGDAHTFELQLALSSGLGAPSVGFIDSVVRAVEAAKPLRSHFTFTVAQNFGGSIGLRAAMRPAVLVRVGLSGLAAGATPSPG